MLTYSASAMMDKVKWILLRSLTVGERVSWGGLGRRGVVWFRSTENSTSAMVLRPEASCLGSDFGRPQDLRGILYKLRLDSRKELDEEYFQGRARPHLIFYAVF